MWARPTKRRLATGDAETCYLLNDGGFPIRAFGSRIVGWNLPLAIHHIAEHRPGTTSDADYKKRTYQRYQGSHQELRFMPKLRKSQMMGS